MNGKYYCSHMHMHSSFEDVASMKGHLHRCRENGVQVIWFTDHDTRMGLIEKRVNEFYFDTPELEQVVDRREQSLANLRAKMAKLPMTDQEREATCAFCEGNYIERTGFHAVCGSVSSSDKTPPLLGHRYSMALNAAHGAAAGATFSAPGKRHQTSLLTDLTFTSYLFAADFDPEIDGVSIDITLSQQPPEHKQKHLIYYAGYCEGLDLRGQWALPFSLEAGKWNEIVLHPSQDVLQFDEFGQDNCFCTVTYTAYTRSSRAFVLNVGGWNHTRKYVADQARARQKELGEKMGEQYGVKVIVSTEVSSCGQHKVCFSSKVPIIDYRDIDYHGTAAYAIDLMKQYGAIWSYNHPFTDYKRYIISDQTRHNIALSLMEKFINCRCDEAAVIEIGYPDGRGCSFDDYLLLWDRLAAEGMFLTGDGCSDNHANDSKWLDDNNFATWIFSKDTQEENLLQGLKSGNVFAGDPVLFKGGELSYTLDGTHPMGSAVYTDKGTRHSLHICLRGAPAGSSLRLVSQGRLLHEAVLPDGSCDVTIPFVVEKPIESPRFEVYAPDARCMLLSNPVYLVQDRALPIDPCRQR